MNKKNKAKRGVSIAEAVVAMAVVVIVSMASISAVIFATNANLKTYNRTRAQNFAQNMLECFKSASSVEEFTRNAAFAEGIDTFPEEPTANGDDRVYEYTPDNNAFSAVIRISFPDNSDSSSRPTFYVKAIDSSGKTIIELNYKKGG